MQLVKGQVSIDPCNIAVFSVLFNDAFHRLMKYPAIRTIKIRIFNNFHRRVWISKNVIVFSNLFESNGALRGLPSRGLAARLDPAAEIYPESDKPSGKDDRYRSDVLIGAFCHR